MASQYQNGATERLVDNRKAYQRDQDNGSYIMAATDSLIGDKVINTEGDDLGVIDSIMIDVSNGRIVYAVLSFGGFLGIGDKLFAIPWEALMMDADSGYFILDMDKSMLKEAPGFDKDNWPVKADVQWVNRIRHYQRNPS